MSIRLELIDSQITPHVGYGAGEGEVIREEYKCPCGDGKVIYEKDDIPGFRDSDIYTTCGICNEKYTFERGIAKEK